MNPYIVKLSIVDDEATLNVSIQILDVLLLSYLYAEALFPGEIEKREAGLVVLVMETSRKNAG